MIVTVKPSLHTALISISFICLPLENKPNHMTSTRRLSETRPIKTYAYLYSYSYLIYRNQFFPQIGHRRQFSSRIQNKPTITFFCNVELVVQLPFIFTKQKPYRRPSAITKTKHKQTETKKNKKKRQPISEKPLETNSTTHTYDGTGHFRFFFLSMISSTTNHRQ